MKRTGTSHAETAIQMADANPQGALVFAVLDLANAIRENGSELENLVKEHAMVATQVGGIAESVNDLAKELA